jgi:hypothetical protein
LHPPDPCDEMQPRSCSVTCEAARPPDPRPIVVDSEGPTRCHRGLTHFTLRAPLRLAADSFAEAGAATPTRTRGDAGPRVPVEYPWSTPKTLDRLNGLARCHPRWTVATNAAATRNITRHPRAVVSLPRAGSEQGPGWCGVSQGLDPSGTGGRPARSRRRAPHALIRRAPAKESRRGIRKRRLLRVGFCTMSFAQWTL